MNKPTHAILILFCLTAASASFANNQPSQCTTENIKQFSKIIIGNWTEKEPLPIGGKSYVAKTTFVNNGHFTGTAVNVADNKDILFTINGTWEFKDGYLYEHFPDFTNKLLNLPDPAKPTIVTTKDQILCASETYFKSKADDGKVEEFKKE